MRPAFASSVLSKSSDGERLSRESILAALGSDRRGLVVDVLDRVDSTSSELLRRAAKRDVHRHVVAAECQTAGRGRRGRPWTSIVGGSLAFSMGWRFERGARQLSALPLAVGLALATSLESEGFGGIALKWPNDLTHRGRKLGGILVELSGDALGPSLAVIGVGLNVRLPAPVRREIGGSVADLAGTARAPRLDRNRLLARILGDQARMLEGYASFGFAPLRASWQRRHALHGESVQVLLPDGGRVLGRVAGVDDDGALVLVANGREMRFVNGEVSLRRS